MVFEHFAVNIEKPVEMAEWYVKNCELVIMKKGDAPHFAHFLADKTGRVVIETYFNNEFPVTDFSTVNHMEFHFAFMVKNAEETKNNLMGAGAEFVEEIKPADGSHLVMLRDPFGMPLQLCQRATPLMDIKL